jgi:hypothetical protein
MVVGGYGSAKTSERTRIMPRNVRNYWVEATIDGRNTALEGGPVAKDGEFRESIYIRKDGDVENAVQITGEVDADGNLNLYVVPNGRDLNVESYSTPFGTGFVVKSKR